MLRLVIALAVCATAPSAWAITKCTQNGSTWYQDNPCPAGAASTNMAGGSAPTFMSPEAAPAGYAPPVTTLSEPAAPLPAPPAHLPLQVLREEAQRCLDWYKKLKPELGAVALGDFTKDGRVVTISIPMQQSYVNAQTYAVVNTSSIKNASCEIYNNRLDDSWTRIHAKRGGWID